jgi:hypothetical protein
MKHAFITNIVIYMTILLSVTGACSKKEKPLPAGEPGAVVDTTLGWIAADTIIYDVVIRNPNPDDAWVEHCLQGVNYGILIDSLFNLVYAGRITVYNHETNEKLTPRQVQELESAQGYSRDNIGMIQFTEIWYLHAQGIDMTKKVRSMVLGYNFYTSDGELIGHKALFRAEMGDK